MTETVLNQTSQVPELTPEQQEGMVWAQGQLRNASKFLAEKGVILETVFNEVSTYMTNKVAIFKIRDKERNKYWVITGDMPTDYAPASVAKDYKEAARHFSLNWQLKAENIIRMPTRTKVQSEFAQLLVNKAEELYSLID